jgi:hypothetical protein
MRITRKSIEKAIKKETGLDVEVKRYDLEYYFTGKVASLFCESSTYYTVLNHTNITLESFVFMFKDRVKKVEKEFEQDIATIIDNIDWEVDFLNDNN